MRSLIFMLNQLSEKIGPLQYLLQVRIEGSTLHAYSEFI